MPADLMAWFRSLRPMEHLFSEDRQEVLVQGINRSDFAHGFLKVSIGSRTVHANLDPLPEGSALLTVIPWSFRWEEANPVAAKSPPQFVVGTVDDVLFYLHEVVDEANGGKWS